MSTIEQEAYKVLIQEPYILNIAGENIKFRQAHLEDLQHISAIVSELPNLNEIDDELNKNADVPQLIDSFKYARKLGDIIMVTAEIEVNVEIDRSSIKKTFFKTKEEIYQDKYNELYNKLYLEEKARIENAVYRKASVVTIWAIVQQILKMNHVFFYQNTIAFLKGMNHLKPTKETVQKVPS